MGPSYNLFNSAAYSPASSRPGSAMSMDNERPTLHRTVKVTVAVDSTDDEDLPADAYLPQRSGGLRNKKKKDLGVGRRPATSTDVSDTESEDCYQVYTNDRMTPMEAKQKAEGDRQKAAEEQAKIQKAKKKAEEDKKKAELDGKRKEEQAKKKAETDAKKKKEEEAQKKQLSKRPKRQR